MASIQAFANGIHHLWFLLMMSVLFAIVISLGKRLLNPVITGSLFIIFILANVVASKFITNVPNYVAWRQSIAYMPAFLFGIATSAFNLAKKINTWKPSIFYIVMILTSIILAIYSQHMSFPYGILYYNLPIYFWMILVYTLLRFKIHIKGENKIIGHFDRHSMAIYIIHHILIWAVLVYIPPVTPFMEQHYILAPALMFIGVFFISWGIATLSSKNRYSNYLFTGKITPKTK